MDHLDNVMDDILIFTKIWEEHVKVLRELFAKRRDANLTAIPSTCFIGLVIWNVLDTSSSILSSYTGCNATDQRHRSRYDHSLNSPAFTGSSYQIVRASLYLSPISPNNGMLEVKCRGTVPRGTRSKMNNELTLRTDTPDIGVGAVLLQPVDDNDELHPVLGRQQVPAIFDWRIILRTD